MRKFCRARIVSFLNFQPAAETVLHTMLGFLSNAHARFCEHSSRLVMQPSMHEKSGRQKVYLKRPSLINLQRLQLLYCTTFGCKHSNMLQIIPQACIPTAQTLCQTRTCTTDVASQPQHLNHSISTTADLHADDAVVEMLWLRCNVCCAGTWICFMLTLPLYPHGSRDVMLLQICKSTFMTPF